MDQVHFTLKAKTIGFSIKLQRKRNAEQTGIENWIKTLNINLQNQNNTADNIEEIREELYHLNNELEDIEEHLAKGTTVRARLEWDINGEGLGKILLKCEERLGQKKYMSSVIKINNMGEITETIKSQDAVQKEITNYWRDIFADKNIMITEEDIRTYLWGGGK